MERGCKIGLKQTYFFTTNQCEAGDHQSCNGSYEGKGIVAKCVCNCHTEKEKLLTPKSKGAEQEGKSKLEEFGELFNDRPSTT